MGNIESGISECSGGEEENDAEIVMNIKQQQQQQDKNKIASFKNNPILSSNYQQSPLKAPSSLHPKFLFSKPNHLYLHSTHYSNCLLPFVFKEEEEEEEQTTLSIQFKKILLIIAHDSIKHLVLQLVQLEYNQTSTTTTTTTTDVQSPIVICFCNHNDIMERVDKAASHKIRLILDHKLFIVHSSALNIVLVSSAINLLSRQLTERFASNYFVNVAKSLSDSLFLHAVIEQSVYIKKITKNQNKKSIGRNRIKRASIAKVVETSNEETISPQSFELWNQLSDDLIFWVLSFTDLRTWSHFCQVNKKCCEWSDRTVWKFMYHELTGTFERIEDETYLKLCSTLFKKIDINWTHDKYPVILDPSLFTCFSPTSPSIVDPLPEQPEQEQSMVVMRRKVTEQITSLLVNAQFYHKAKPTKSTSSLKKLYLTTPHLNVKLK